MSSSLRGHLRLALILIGLSASACLIWIVFILVLVRIPAEFHAAGQLIAAPAPTLVHTPAVTRTILPTSSTTMRKTLAPPPSETPRPTATRAASPTRTPANALTHFILGRPVGPNANSIIPDWTYLYGDTEHGQLEVHHGEEFENPLGTPLLAVADGTVVVAGNDSQPLCGDDGAQVCGTKPNYYGNLVVVKLDQRERVQPIYTLCGHMDTLNVRVGQHVQAGDPIGTVGDTGVAVGPHCHFEVRLGVNDYGHTRNPVLWMKPLPGTGAVAGSVLDRHGNFLPGLNVFIYKDNATQDWVMDTETYGRETTPNTLPVNPDDQLHENWALGDLKEGQYLLRVKIGSENYYKRITIRDGQLTFVVFQAA